MQKGRYKELEWSDIVHKIREIWVIKYESRSQSREKGIYILSSSFQWVFQAAAIEWEWLQAERRWGREMRGIYFLCRWEFIRAYAKREERYLFMARKCQKESNITHVHLNRYCKNEYHVTFKMPRSIKMQQHAYAKMQQLPMHLKRNGEKMQKQRARWKYMKNECKSPVWFLYVLLCLLEMKMLEYPCLLFMPICELPLILELSLFCFGR